jgi:hypothetical protein
MLGSRLNSIHAWACNGKCRIALPKQRLSDIKTMNLSSNVGRATIEEQRTSSPNGVSEVLPSTKFTQFEASQCESEMRVRNAIATPVDVRLLTSRSLPCVQSFIGLSCVLAVGCNISQFMCIGRFSAVTFQVTLPSPFQSSYHTSVLVDKTLYSPPGANSGHYSTFSVVKKVWIDVHRPLQRRHLQVRGSSFLLSYLVIPPVF